MNKRFINPLWRCALSFVWLVSLPGSSNLESKFTASEITLSVDTQIDSNDDQACTAAPSDCSLRGAITRANLDAGNEYIIQVPAGVYNLTLEGALEDVNATGDLDISGRVTLVGDGADGTWIDANQIDRVLHVLPGAKVELRDITLQGGQTANCVAPGTASEHGGGIFNRGELTLMDTMIRENRTGDGVDGAIDGDLEIDGGDAGSGGGIYNLGIITLVDSTIVNNLAGKGGNGFSSCESRCTYAGDGGSGGGILNIGRLNLESSLIMSNTIGQAGLAGGCSWPDPWGFYPGACILLEHKSGKMGTGAGGIDNYGAVFLMDSAVIGNLGNAGGGISNQAEAVIERCFVERNSGGSGGGIFNSSNLVVEDSWIQDNNGASGGGIHNSGSATVMDTHIVVNSTRQGEPGRDADTGYKGDCIGPKPGQDSQPGGGVYNSGDMMIDHSQVSFNSTGDGGRGGNVPLPTSGWCAGERGADGGGGGNGGGIYNSGFIEMNLCTMTGNTTGNGGMGGESEYGDGSQGLGGAGGGLYNMGTAWINLSTFDGNQTGEGLSGGPGGAIANEGQLTITGGSLRGNLTIQDGNGGGIYASSPITISAVAVISNTAAGSGGGLSFEDTTGQVANSILGHNQSGIFGSGLYASGSIIQLENGTIAQNHAGDGSGLHVISSTLRLTNTILVSHTIGVVIGENSLVDMESTLWGSGAWANVTDWAGSGAIITGTHNYREDPGFLDPGVLDYHITPSSAAIHRGVNNGLDADIDFQPRPNTVSQFIDLGADEYWLAIPIETVSLTGQPTVTRRTSITLTATISPENATPNILYYWQPPPEAGQWTENALYAWQRSGTEQVTLMAINAASAVSDTLTIIVEPVYSTVYLPSIGR